ncbi:hypothetical protein BUALT_Bualt10G0121700 [Buddleja alternifolia]|uniref:Uncharacterized protein n=1 Tax=Buddleja alternifolia TaxID=168488 RepID=A0AAV6WY66_9LAMI|nr:hypothetical protein BUALT_Bualt10G0121700 [Buddleja alternifolia]
MERNNTHLMRSESRSTATTSSDFVLQWGNRKRLRCMKVQGKDHAVNNGSSGSGPVQRATSRVDRRVIRSDLNNNGSIKDPSQNQLNNNHACKSNGGGNGYLNLRQRSASPSHRILRNSESSIGMRGHSNGVRGLVSPDRVDKKSGLTSNNNINNNNNNSSSHHHHNKNNTSYRNDNHGGGGGGSGSSETALDGKKGGSLSNGDTIAAVWPPKFVIALTNKEKEEDFMAIKGSKLPQRPKKRAKFIQRTLSLVSPGAWLCDLTLERYEVREKKVSKKRPRGLKAMGNVDSDSE